MKNLAIKTGFDTKAIQKFLLLSACSFGVFLSTNQQAFAQVRQDLYMNQLPYITGGFGNEEQNQIKQHAEQFNLHLTFAQVADRAYIGGVKVAITDAKGNEVSKDDNLGPLLYLKLNPGQYTLSMDYQGQVKTESVQLESNKTQEIVVTW